MAIVTQCLCISGNEMLEYENAHRHKDDKEKRWTGEKFQLFLCHSGLLLTSNNNNTVPLL